MRPERIERPTTTNEERSPAQDTRPPVASPRAERFEITLDELPLGASPELEDSSWAAPSLRERARAMRSAYEAAEDEHTRALLGGLLEHFRRWCIARGCGDPAPAPRIVRRRLRRMTERDD